MTESVFPRKIMLATDGSKYSLEATKKTAQIAKMSNSDVIVVHVTEIPFLPIQKPLSGDTGPLGLGTTFETESEEKIHANEILVEAKQIFDNASVRTSVRLLNRSPQDNIARIIVNEAAKEDVDLLVVGATGRSGLETWLLGSVSEKVIRHAPCPVLVVR